EPHAQALEDFWWAPVPEHLLRDVDPSQLANAPYNRAPVGSGPFRFGEWRASDRLVLVPNEAFPEALGGPAASECKLVEGRWNPDRIRLRESLDPEAAGSARAAEVEGKRDSGMSQAGSWEWSGADSIVVSLPGFEFRLRAEADELVGSGRRLVTPGVEVGDTSYTAMRFERVPCPNP
ncbi:MAG: hypothetical protein P8049_10235, partial [Gemmatimonadota bacterium]